MPHLALLLALAAPALAGDPCPITLNMSEYTPPWRDRDADLAGLKSKRKWMGLVYADEGGEVRVKRVMPGSPAERSGLKVGDRIATLNGTPVATSAATSAAFDALPQDAVVTLGLQRDGAAHTAQIARGPADPVFLGLVNVAETTECRDVTIVGLTEAQRSALLAGAFDANHGFRCDDAHVALKGAFESGSLVMVRGGHRILITQPGWSTTCVGVDAYDGETQLTKARLGALLEAVTKAYVKDRYENP